MDESSRKQFGVFLRSLRTRLDLTQRQAGEAAGVSCPYLAQLERGQRNPPSREILRRLANAYSTEESVLLMEAGYEPGRVNSLPRERLEWAFETLCRDPNFSTTVALRRQSLTVETKAFLVELYIRTTGRQLLTSEETHALSDLTIHKGSEAEGSTL